MFDCFSPAVLLSGYKEKLGGGGDKGNMGRACKDVHKKINLRSESKA